MNGAEVVVEHVRKAFEGGRIRALEDVSLRIAPGELVALTGASGSGKSTLLNLIGALDSETGAQIVALLQRLRASRGMTILLVTNDRAVADQADRVLELRDGRVIPAAAPRPA